VGFVYTSYALWSVNKQRVHRVTIKVYETDKENVRLLILVARFEKQWTQNNSELELRYWKRGREDGKGKGQQDVKESVWVCTMQLKTFSPFLISIQSVAFSYTDFYTALYFVNQRNYKTLATQAHALTRTRYFYSLNVIISHPIVYKEGLGYLSVCAIASRSSPPSHVRICNSHPGSELCCVRCSHKLCSVYLSPSFVDRYRYTKWRPASRDTGEGKSATG
jgi:hypothetical protein